MGNERGREGKGILRAAVALRLLGGLGPDVGLGGVVGVEVVIRPTQNNCSVYTTRVPRVGKRGKGFCVRNKGRKKIRGGLEHQAKQGHFCFSLASVYRETKRSIYRKCVTYAGEGRL